MRNGGPPPKRSAPSGPIGRRKRFSLISLFLCFKVLLFTCNFVLQPQCLGIGIFTVPLLLAETPLCQEEMTTHHHVMITTVLKTGISCFKLQLFELQLDNIVWILVYLKIHAI